MNKIKIVLIILGLSFLPMGCMVGSKYAKPEMLEANQYKHDSSEIDSTKTVLNVKWFELFNDEVLIGLINKGIESNYDLKMALTRIERSRAELGYSKADLLPSFGYGGTINSNEKNIPPSNVGAFMSWELDFWGKIRHQNRALQAELLGSDEGRKVILTDIVSGIAISYFQLRDLDNQLEITKKTLETRQEAYKIINDRFVNGYVSEVDKLQIEQQVAIAEAAIPNIERSITVYENIISILMGQVPGPIERGKSNSELKVSSEIPLSIPSSLLVNRPDVRQAELYYMAAHERIGVAQAMKYPSFNIGAAAGFSQSSLSNLFVGSSYLQNLSAGVIGPIFNFGKNNRRIQIYRQEAEESKYMYQKTYLTAIAEVEKSLQDVKTYKEEWESRNRQVIAARRNFELSSARYFSGYVSYLEVLDVQRNLFTAELSLSNLTQLQLTSMVELYKALGGGWN